MKNVKCLKCGSTKLKVTMNFSQSQLIQCQDCKETFMKVKWPKKGEETK